MPRCSLAEVRRLSALLRLDASRALVHSQDTGALESGNSYDKRRVLGFLDRWAAGAGARAWI
ncbi:MAG: hypothetical protein ABI316_05535 [Casimicrobiaceae bacterium]